MIIKFQQGGQAANQKALMQFVQGIAQVLKVDPKQIVQIAQQKPESLNAAVQVFQQTQDIQQAAQAFAQAVQKAKQGAKLQYISSLKNKCKEGEELVYMKAGGRVCPVCQKKKVQAEKCGGSTKKFKKMWDGGEMPSQQPKKPQQKTQQKPTKQTPLPTKWDQKKHDELIRKFKKNPKGMSKAQMDSLHYYNMKDPRERGV